MTDSIDPVALLDSMSPPTGWNERVDVDGAHTDPRAVAILRSVVDGTVVPFRRRPNRFRVVTGIVVVATLGSVAAAALWARSPDEVRTLSCWSEPAAPPAEQVGVGWDGTGDPVELCGPAWSEGQLGTDGPPEELQTCVTDEGIAAVVPGSCDALGLANYAPLADVPSPEDRPRSVEVAELERLLIDDYNTGQCIDPDTATTSIEAELSTLGFDDWSVELGGTFSAAEPCATVAVDRELHTILIVPDRDRS
jgi:hypothetical protein